MLPAKPLPTVANGYCMGRLAVSAAVPELRRQKPTAERNSATWGQKGGVLRFDRSVAVQLLSRV